MPWELELRYPLGGLITRFTNDTTPNPVMGEIEALVDGGGRTNSLNLRARNDLLQAPPRGILTYQAWRNLGVTFQGRPVTHQAQRVTMRDNREPLAAGVIVTVPPATSPGSGPADKDADALDRITAVGLEHLLKERIVGARAWEGDLDVATIAFELCQAYAHPAIVVEQANFPPTGYRLGVFYAPEMTVTMALDKLKESVPGGATWHVRADRRITFRAAGGA